VLGAATLLIVSVFVFALTHALGDPARAILGRDAQIPEALAAKRSELGLDRPALRQYFTWLGNMLGGDPGTSYTNDEPILDLMSDRIRNSLILMWCAAVVSIPVSLLLGMWSAVRRDHIAETSTSMVLLALSAIPEFVLGTFLVVIFSVTVFRVLPAVSSVRGDTAPWDDLDGMVLPTMTLVLVAVPYLVRSIRATMIEVLESDYVQSSQLLGLRPSTIVWRHALPNAVGSTLQVIALGLAYMAGGVVVVEKVFNYPGLGSALVDAVAAHNVPVVQFITLVFAALYIACNTLADIGTVLVTPRLRTRLT